MRRDRFTGLYHTHFREYDAIHGRWLSEDPAGYADGLNLYQAYMGVNGTDPLGLANRGDVEKATEYAQEAQKRIYTCLAELHRLSLSESTTEEELYRVVDAINQFYNDYIEECNLATKTAAEFIDDQWYYSGTDDQAVQLVNGLPMNVEQLRPSSDQLEDGVAVTEEMLDACDGLCTRTAGLYYTGKTLEIGCTVVSAAGGVTMLAQTAAKQGLKEGAKFVAKEVAKMALRQAAANYVAAPIARKLGFTEEQIRVGMVVYQSLSIYRSCAKVQKLKSTSVSDTSKTYQTYTKTNPKTGQVYSGRTSGKGTPLENIAKRDAGHQMNKKGYGPAKLDRSSSNSAAIRGREQQLMDNYGGPQSMGGTSGNAINGISPKNPLRQYYLDEANKEF